MKFKKSALVMAFAILLSSTAHSGFVSLDWKVEGDARATLDDVTGYEWLKLNETAGMSINQVKSELGAGGLYEGWRLATQDDVLSIVQEFIPFTVNPESSYHTYRNLGSWTASMAEFSVISDVLGSSYKSGAIPVYSSVGLSINNNGVSVISGVQLNQSTFASGHRLHYYNNLINSYTEYSSNPNLGVYLVGDGGATLTTRNDLSLTANNLNSKYYNVSEVSEPATLTMFGLGMIGMLFRKKKKSI